MTPPIEVNIPAKFAGLFFPCRYKTFYGGRGSAKSWTFALAVIVLASEKKMRILCAREMQNSIGDSVHKLLADTIERLGLGNFWDVFRDEIRCHNGSEIIFEGLRYNQKRIKSLEGVDVCWVEEADSLSNESWNLLIPTIRKKGSEIWVSFNRDTENDPAFVRFVENAPANSLVEKVTWRDNPWFPQVLVDEIRHDMKHDPERAAHVWDGEPWGRSDARVFAGRYRIEEFNTPENTVFYCGADWGFARDPNTVVRCFIEDDKLFIDAEAFGHGVEIQETPAFLASVLPSRAWPLRADSARPELISYLNGEGFNVIAAHKGPGSIEEGIKNLLSFHEIIVHPKCTHVAEEMRLYSYKVDPRTGDVLPIILDKNNHCIDALRYALEEVYRQQSGGNISQFDASEIGL